VKQRSDAPLASGGAAFDQTWPGASGSGMPCFTLLYMERLIFAYALKQAPRGGAVHSPAALLAEPAMKATGNTR